MVRSADPSRTATRMVELRAVESAFPLYGELKLANGKRFELLAVAELRRAGAPRAARATGAARRRPPAHRHAAVHHSRRDRGRTGASARRVQPRSPRVRVVRGSRQDRSSHLRQPRLSPASGEGLRFGDRPAGQPPARRLRQQLCPRPLVQGDRRRYRRGLHPRRGLLEPRRAGDRHSGRHRRVERHPRFRRPEDQEHRHPEVPGRSLASDPGHLHGAGHRARPRGERLRRGDCAAWRSPPFLRRWPLRQHRA